MRASRTYSEGPLTFEATFSENLFLAGSLRRGPFTPGTDDFTLLNLTTGQTTAPLSVIYDAVTDKVLVTYDTLPEGDYTLTMRSGLGAIEDQIGNDMDGEPLGANLDGTITGNGVPGGDYVVGFSIDRVAGAAQPFAALEPLGGLIYASQNNTRLINAPGDQDIFQFTAEGILSLSAIVTPVNPAAKLSLELLGLSGVVTAAAPGESVSLPLTALPASSLLELRVSGDAKSAYSLELIVNAAIEPASDSSVGNALAIDASLLTLGSGRYGVVGHSNGTAGTPDVDAYTLNLSGKAGRRLDIVLAGAGAADFSQQRCSFWTPTALFWRRPRELRWEEARRRQIMTWLS